MSAVEKLSIALTPEFATEIRTAVASGEFASTSEVIRAALRAWRRERERRAAAVEGLRELWREGLEGEPSEPLDADEIKRRGRARLAALRGSAR